SWFIRSKKGGPGATKAAPHRLAAPCRADMAVRPHTSALAALDRDLDESSPVEDLGPKHVADLPAHEIPIEVSILFDRRPEHVALQESQLHGVDLRRIGGEVDGSRPEPGLDHELESTEPRGSQRLLTLTDVPCGAGKE